MSLGENIQYLRKQKRLTQEQLAETMEVSRQTVSRWESNEVTPELAKLVELCELFSCKLDALVREELSLREGIYSGIQIRRLKPFAMARYVIISPNPEDDVNAYMDHWACTCGLRNTHPEAKRIGWDFPFVSLEQRNRFGLRGYTAAYVLPEGFETDHPGVEYCRQQEADYAVITIKEPFRKPFERIPDAYKRILEYIRGNGLRERPQENVLECFEYVYETDGQERMDVYVHVEGVSKPDATVKLNG